MTATPITPVEEREEDDDILEWVAPEGELPTEFTWDGEEEGDTTTTVDTDIPQPVDTDTTTTTDTTETTVVEPISSEQKENPILSWLSNATSEVTRINVQELLADYTGLAAEGGKGDAYWNQFLDPNNFRNIGGGINAEGGNILSSTEHDNMWVRLPNGDSYSLKTGMLYPRHLMPENDKDLLKDESILTQIGRKFERQERLPLSEVTALANDPNNTLTGHPALTRVEAIKAKLTEVNLTLPDDQKLGPTGDYGVPEDRKLNWLFGGLANTEEGTIQQRELEHGEGIVGGFVGYMIPILAASYAISRGGKVTGIPTSIPALNRAATVPLKTAPVKTSIARVVKGIIDLAPESYLVTRAVESDRQNLVNLINPDNALAIQTDDDNQTRRSKNALVDFLIVGPPFGIGAEFLGPATKSLRRSTFKNIKQIPQQVLSLPKKGKDLINRLADSIIDNLNLERADQQLELALELQQKGPSVDVKAETVSEEVIPTTRVTGSSKPVPEKPAPENVIQPKATQAELDTQVKEAEARQIKASDKAKTSTEDLINQSATIEPKDVRPRKKLSEQFEEDLDALKGGIDQALDTAHRQVQKHQRRISLEGIETNLIDRTNAHEFPAKAKRSEIEDHLTDLDTEFVRRSNELSKRNRANDNKYGGREWPTEVREKWNADFQDRQALADRRDILKESIRDFDAARDTNFAAPEDVIKLGGLEKEVADEARFREWIKDPGDPELKQLFDEIEELNAKTEKDIKASDELIARIDNEMDKLDEIIYGDADITDVKREEFENIYQNLDAKRQEVKSDIDEIEAKEVKGIDAVVNEEQFKKFFQDLPVEKQRALLDELRTEGAIVSMPGKIGDTPPPVDAIKSKTKFKKGGIAEAMQSVIDDLKASDERTKELFDQTLQVAKDALDLADGKIPRKEGPIVDVEATVVDDLPELASKKVRQASAKARDLTKKLKGQESLNEAFALTETPEVPADLKATIGRYRSIRYRHDRVSFESDLDSAIYTISGHNRSKAHDRLVQWVVNELGIPPQVINDVSMNIRRKIKQNKAKSPNSIVTIKDSRAWEQSGHLDLMMEEPKDLGDIIAKRDAEIYEKYQKGEITKEQYEKATSPQDPGDQLDPKNLQFAELPDLGKYGDALGDGDPQRVMDLLLGALTERQQIQLSDELDRILGKDIADLFVTRDFRPVAGEKQAAAYGGKFKAGSRRDVRGAWDAKKQLVILSMMHKGDFVSYGSAFRTLWHEAFHGIQDLYLTVAEKTLLAASRKKLVEVAGRGFPTVRLGFFEGLSDKELQAYAFAAWHKVRSEYKADSWARPFEKLTRTLARVANAVKGMGFQTWEDIFEVSAKGEMANRAPRNIGDEGIQFEIDPDDLVEGMGKYREGIEDGSIDVEKAMESETRRLISRSGKTDYIARESTDLIAMNASMEQALREAFGDRAEVTGMPAYKIGQLFDKAAKQVQADGYDVNTTILNYEQARKGDFQSMDDLYAAAGILHHREANLEILAKAAVEYESAGDDALAGAAGKRMIGAMEDQLKLDIAWQGVTRKSAQTLRIAQTSHETALASSLPTGTEFKQTVAPEVADKAIKEGFTPTDGLLGEGVYFSTSSVAGPSGSVELYGRSLDDVPILDLASSQQRVTDLLRELNLGKAKKGKDGFQLTPSQEAGIRDYVVGEGYGGVRYGTDFLSKIPGEDQIVIYDVNTANRMIDSDAAIPPAKEEGGESVRTLLENSIKQTENILEKRLPPDVRESIAKGELTAEAREILDGMRVIAYHLKNTPGAKKAFADSIEGIPHGQLKGNAIANLIRNMLFFSMRTWMKVFFGTGYRAATLPLTQMIGTSRSQIREFVKGNPDGLKLANRRQTLNMMLYPKYLQNLPYAVRMMVSALKHNESFVNIGKTQSEITARKGFAPSDQLELDLMSKRMREEPTGNEWWLQTDANPIALAIRASWDGFSTVSGRIMGGLDSFWAGMVGPSTEWARLMEMNLFKADVKGFEPGSEKAWNWAAEQTETMLQKHFQDIDLANGEVIKDGRLVGNHAKKAMDWVTFTDDIWVPTKEPRTYEYGVRKAQEEGITDAREVIEYANAWVKEDPEDSEFRQFLEKVVNAPGVGGKMLYGKNIWQNTVAAMIRPTNRTPVNLVKGAMRMLPGTNQMVDTFQRDLNSEDFFTRDRALGELGMGFTTLMFGVQLANSGLVQFSGPASANPQERFEADRAGWQPWSIRFRLPNGDWSDWYDITMFDTAANIFGTIGAYTENVSNMSEEMADNFQGFLTVALGGTAREMTLGQFTKTALGSLNNITDLIVELQSDDVRFVSGSRNQMEKFLTDRLAMFWPAFSNVARNAVDPVRRRIDASKLPFPLNMVENAVKTIALRTPGLSATQPAYLHPIRGTELPSNTIPGNRMIPKDEPWMKMFHDLIVPWGVTKAKEGSNDPVDLEMLRLQGRGGTFQIWNRRMFNLNDRVLDSHELNRLIIIGTQEVKINGQTLYEALLSEIQTKKYDDLPENDHTSSLMSRRVRALNQIIKPYKEQAKLRFIEETDVPGGIGFEIKKQQDTNRQYEYDAEYGIDVSVSRLDALRQLAS